MFKKLLLILSAFLLSVSSFAASAQAVDLDKVKALYESKIKTWLNDPIVIEAIKAQNVAHAGLSEADIKALDDKWRADDAATVDPVLNNPLSDYLSNVVYQGEGLYSEVFVMDDKGLNVGQSSKTSDFWQGDEEKFTETFPKGDGAMHMGEVEFDESSQSYQVQLSVTVSDNGIPIGAATIGIDAEMLEQ